VGTGQAQDGLGLVDRAVGGRQLAVLADPAAEDLIAEEATLLERDGTKG